MTISFIILFSSPLTTFLSLPIQHCVILFNQKCTIKEYEVDEITVTGKQKMCPIVLPAILQAQITVAS
jgi:hypothetical protein